MKQNPFTSLPRAARRLGVSLHRAIEMIHAQRLRARLTGGRWWVETRSIVAVLRARKQRNQSGGHAA